MKLAFWNVNTGTGSFKDKLAIIKTWIDEVRPDLLMLEEVSSTLATDKGGQPLEQLTGYKLLASVNTLDKNFDNSTKCLVALANPKSSVPMDGRMLTFPGLEQTRALTKIVTKTTPSVEIWCIHANASARGGAAARKAVEDFLATEAGKATIVGGDFNAGISAPGNAKTTIVQPLRWDGKPLTSTQWTAMGDGPPSTGDYNKGDQQKAFGFSNSVFVNKTIRPNGVIDYLAHGTALKVAAANNCVNEATWRTIVAQFDHAPVVYTL